MAEDPALVCKQQKPKAQVNHTLLAVHDTRACLKLNPKPQTLTLNPEELLCRSTCS